MATYNDRNQLLISSASRITGASVSIKNSFGNQLLVPKNSAVPYPQNITLTAVASKYLNPQYSWFYKIGTGEYDNLNLSTSVITLNLDADWLTAVGANTTVTYKVQVTETSGSLGINGTEAEFVVPVLREGTDGTSAWNNIIVRIYRRSTTNAAPSIDRSASQSSTYTFSNGSLVGAPLGWSTSIPETGGDYIFVSEYSAVSQLTSVQFTNDNWSVPVLYVKSGNVGSSGIVVFAYKRSATALLSTDKPTNPVTYSFATNTITTEDLGGGWSKSIPTGTDTLYIVAATASSSTETDTIPTTEWSSPVEFVRNGANGTSPVVGLLTNESATVAAANDGTVSSFAGTGGVFKVFEGLTDKTGSGVTYSVVAGTASGVTISIDATGTYTVSAMSVDTGTATLRAVYAGVIVDKVYSIAKSKAGASGSAAITAILSNENHVFTADSAGAIAAGSYGGSGTQVRVYEGSTELTYDAVGTANGTWKVTASATSITAGAITDSGVYATVGNASGMSSLSNTAIITYTITGRSLTGTNFSIVKTQTFSKSKAGLNGTSPIIYEIVLSAPVITKDSKDAATAGSYSSVTIQGTYTTGSTTINYGFITVTADNDAEETTAINTAVEPYLLAPATTANTSKYTVKLYDAATVATATLLDTQVINVVFKGADGAPSKYVNLTTTAQAFAYNSEGATPNPVTATFTATAYNTTGTVYYEFLVGATSKANTTTNTYTYTPQSAYSSMPEQITVKVREGSTTGTVVATDTMSVIGIKPGAAGNTVAVPYLYARNNSVSSAPAFTTTDLTTLTFTFASGALTGTPPTNWYKEPPDVSTGSVLWVRTAVAFSSDATYSIPWASWGDAKVLSTSGVRGSRNLYSNNADYTSTYQPNPNLTAGLENYREKATLLIADATSGSIPTTPIKGDTVTFTNGTTYVFTLTYDGSAWNPPGTVIDGSLLVTGSVTAAKINSTGLTIRNTAGQVVFGAGSGEDSVNLGSQYITPASGWLNSNVQVNSSGALTGIGTGSGTIVNNQLVESTKLIASGNVTVSGTSIISSTGGDWGTAQVYSSEGYAGGAYASFTVKTVGASRAFMAGLNTASDLTDGGYTSLDFAFYFAEVNTLQIYESGNFIGNFGTFADGDTFAVVYDGFQIFYYKNGSVVRTKTQTVTQKLFFDSAIATTSSTPLLTNIKFSPLPSTSTAKNFADTSWWTWQDFNNYIFTQYGVLWSPNAGSNKITTSRDALINQPSPLAGVSSDFVWYLTEPDSSNNAGGGWEVNLYHSLDPTKTYRFVVPVMKLSGGDGSGNFYWGTYGVCDLNTTTTNTNPYFYSNQRSQLVENRWYLMIGYVFPYGSTNNTHEGAGLIDTTTGLYVGLGTNYAHTSAGAYAHRAYQYYANAGNRQVFGRPEIYEVNGTEPPLSRYMTLASTMNASINVDSNGVLQGAGNQAVVANNKITVDSNGVLQGAGSQVSVGNNTDTAIREPGGGVYRTTTSTVTGALKIRLPQAFTGTMMKFTVEVYEYESGYSFTCEIGGYTFGYNNSNTWINTSARILGGSNVEYPVRFGFDGTKTCVWIGNQNETWSYPQVRVKDFFAGYSNTSASLWSSGWEISFDQTALTTGTGANQYSSEILDTYPGADWSKTARRPANLSTLSGSEPINNADISVSLSSSGALSASGGPTVTGAVTIRGLGFVGDLAATSGKSLSPPLSNWNLNGTNTLETISDGKVGNQVVRLNTAGNMVNAPVYVPLDRSKIYRTRFWARPVNTNGLLYFALRQFKNTSGTTGDTNLGFHPYKPGGISQATHNSSYGTGQWGEYTYTWSSADWQTGVYFLVPTFLWSYNGTTGYWEIQDFTFEEVTEVVTAQAGINDKLSKSTASILSSTISVDAAYGAGFRAVAPGTNLTWDTAGNITSGAGNPGVALTPGGLVGVNASNEVTFSINATNGSATFAGNLNVKSASSGARTEITNSVIKIYDSSGTLRVKLGDLNA